MSKKPDISIDFTRSFSLPVGVPPDSVVSADLAKFQAELGIQLEFFELAWDATDPYTSAEHPRDPFTGRLNVRFVRNAGALEVVTVPTSLNLEGIAAADMRTINFGAAMLAPVAKETWTPVTPSGGETMSTAMARTFRWDKDCEKKLWAVPQPYFADESLCMYWPSPAASVGALGTDIPGIFADDASSHLLATTAATRNGELRPDLLRSPVRGLARFTRYRHVGFTESSGSLSVPIVRAVSATGAVVLHALPLSTAVPSDPGAPLLHDTFLVFEHVSISEASACIAGLWWLQILRFAELEAITQLKKEVRTSTAWAFAIYLALTMIRPTTNDALGGLAAVTCDKIRKVSSTPDLLALRTAIKHVLADSGRRSAFADFLCTTLAPLACGVSWVELGIAGIPSEPGARSAGNKEAYALLEAAQQAKDIWVAVYAGAPVGRPATCYRTSLVGVPVSDIARNGFTTFDLEALVLAGRAATMFPSVPPPVAPASPDQSVALTAYDGEALGQFATLRVADTPPGSIAFTMRDWLRHLVFGWQRTKSADAPLDFSDMAAASHPLTIALAWDRRMKARALRKSLDDAHIARNGAGKSLDKAALTWWSTAIAFTTGACWPVALPGVALPSLVCPAGTNPAGPQQPSIGAETRRITEPSGFDEEDLELALEAREHLRNGHDNSQSVDIALILALLDREGYRMNGPYMRQGPFDAHFRDNLNGATLSKAAFMPASLSKRGAYQGIGRVFYALQSYGLDLVDVPHVPVGGVGAVDNWLRFSWDSLFSVVTTATMVGTVTNLNTMGLDGRMLLRTTSRFDPITTIGQSRLLSRRVHLTGVITQHGEFQRRHALLCQGSAAGGLNKWWQPLSISSGGTVLPDVPQFTTDPAPTPGTNAEDIARCDYLAYYALCYLAFNGSPSVWKSWVDLATALGAVSVPRFLLYEITDADVLSGVVVPNPVNPLTGQRLRELWHRGHFARFAVALDAYLRMSDTGVGDVAFPVRVGWGV